MKQGLSSTGNNPIIGCRAVADAAVAHYGRSFLRRGGAVGRAQAEVRRGRANAEAAHLAARQGKGHAAELRLTAEQSLIAGTLGSPSWSRPNPLANDPSVDAQVFSGRRVASTAQVGVGSVPYLRRKAKRAKESGRVGHTHQFVVNSEALDDLQGAGARDHLLYQDTRSGTLTEVQAAADARKILERVLAGHPGLPLIRRSIIAGMAGAESFLLSSATAAVVEIVDAFRQGRRLSSDIAVRAFRHGLASGARTAAQTFVMVSAFFKRARSAFSGRLLRAIGRSALWTGAVVDVIMSTAVDLVRWLRGALTFEDVLRRAGVQVCAAAGAAGGVFLALGIFAGSPLWIAALACGVGGWLGGEIGGRTGMLLFEPEGARIPQRG